MCVGKSQKISEEILKEQPWFKITLNKQRTANNRNCSHQLSSTEGDVRAQTVPDRTYNLLPFLHSQINVKHNFRKSGTYAVVLQQ